MNIMDSIYGKSQKVLPNLSFGRLEHWLSGITGWGGAKGGVTENHEGFLS